MKKMTITKLSRNGFILLLLSAVLGGAVVAVLFLNLEKLNKHIINYTDMHKSFLDIKSSTHNLLTSPYLKNSIDELNNYVLIYNKKVKENKKSISPSIEKDWQVCLKEIKDINQLVKNKYFNDEHLKNRALLKVEGELLSRSSATQFYNEVTTLVKSIKYLLQYETFILKEYEKHNLENNSKQIEQVDSIKNYATLSIIIFLLLLLIISLNTIKNISKNEIKLINTQRLIRNIIDNAPVRIFWKDVNSVYLGANKLFLEDVQVENEEKLIGTSDFDNSWKQLAQSYVDDDRETMLCRKPKLRFEEKIHVDDDTTIYIVTSKIPLFDDEGKVIGVLGIYDDITSQKMLEEDVQKKEALLVQQSRLAQMGEMISMIAHQWRQPLAAISAIAINLNIEIELDRLDLKSNNGKSETKKYLLNELKNINSLVQSLTTTIDDFRNFYKLNKESVSIETNEVIKKALGIIKASLINYNIEIIENYNSKNKVTIYDNEMMQVILNILKNAQDNFIEKNIKNPYIKITTYENSIEICDNGGGIKEDIIEKVFDPYFSTKSEKNGTGLGLYMSKIIIEEHHNGELTAKNIKDSSGYNGACFQIKIGKLN